MTNPIVVLLGAGASFPYGVPTMSAFYREFQEYVGRRHPHCAEFLQMLEKNGGHATPDLETLLADLQSVLGIEQGVALIGGDGSGVTGHVDTARELRGYLDAFIISRCEQFDRERPARELPTLLSLRSFGPLWIFSTNYDRIVEEACEANHVGWSDGFEVACPRPVADWTNAFETEVRLVKLHGSVNWYQDDPGGQLHRLDRGYSLPAHDFRLLRAGQQLRPLMIIPTLEKQALSEPYIGLSTRFTDVLKDSKLLIVVGNSLRDQHIRAYIRERLGSLRVLLVSPSASDHTAVLGTPDRTHSLDAGFSELLALGRSALVDLAQAATAASDDEALRLAIEAFIARMGRDVEDDATARANDLLAPIWSKLKSDIVSARVDAVRGLRDHPHPAITRRLSDLAREDSHPAVRVAAIDALLHLSGAGAVGTFGAALAEDPVIDVQLEAALALGKCGPLAKAQLETGLSRIAIHPVVKKTIESVMAGGTSLP